MKEIKIYNTLIAHIDGETSEYDDLAEQYADQIFEALENDDTDLAPYADNRHGETYASKLHSTKITVEWVCDKLYGVCIALVDDDWTDTDTEQLKDYLIGQYADGWGEGFEQREIESYTEMETSEEYDEEADEYYESEWPVRYEVYISFWQNKNFRIMTEAELKG